MRIERAEATELFVGHEAAPQQVVRVTLVGAPPRQPPSVAVHGRGLSRSPDAVVRILPPDLAAATEGLATAGAARAPTSPGAVASEDRTTMEVGVAVDPVQSPGTRIPAQVEVTAADGADRRLFDFVVAEPGWRMFMVSHFHYDPVWWNTQAFYTETWEKWPRSERPWEGRRQQPAFTLIDAHVDLARRDPDYRFVLAELDYLKPYWDAFPEQRAYLRRLLADGRLELMGGTYNEANTNLTSAETTIRNAVYGIGYQRDVLGGAPATAWQLDVFGHDPQFPGLMADAGLTSSSWARGPFHQWGPGRAPGGNARMQFPSEFDWVAPSGRALLTSYMPNHYSAGWELDAAPTLADAEGRALRLFGELKTVAATRNVLLPVGTDYTPPNRWITQVHRDWNARYTWPRFGVALPRDFFAAVAAELADRGGAVPQTRDMNPVYTGKDVSYIDTKQAHRAAENMLFAAEAFATFAAMLGARHPAEAFDKAWRQLLFNAHHDGITGTESDQVYLDLVGGWWEAWELAREALHDALDHLGAHVDTAGEREHDDDDAVPSQRVIVWNPLSWSRTDVVHADIDLPEPVAGLRVSDEAGRPVPFVVENRLGEDDHDLRRCTIAFLTEVPALGYRTYAVGAADDLPAGATWRRVDGVRIRNRWFELAVDPERGGAMRELTDLETGRSVLKPGGLAGELLAYDEYPEHPDQGEGPWHLLPKGTVTSGAELPATVAAERSALGERLVASSGHRGGVAGTTTEQTFTLLAGVRRVVCRTTVDDFAGQDVLLRLRVAADVPGGLPVSDVAAATIGRGFGFPQADVAVTPYTLDNPAYSWFGVGATARVAVRTPDEPDVRATRALAVAEVVVPDAWTTDPAVRDLVVALVRSGVTSTVSRADGSRYGAIDADSNLPDVRLAVGGPDDNSFVAALLSQAEPAARRFLDEQLACRGAARVWVPASAPLHEVWRPGADLRGERQLPVLVVAGTDEAAIRDELAAVCADLADAVLEVAQPPAVDGYEAVDGTGAPADDYTVGICNGGVPSFVVDPAGDLHLSVMRACSGWPAGVWLDPPRRTVPDGSSFQFQHWTHVFDWAITAGAGDWRDVGMVRAAREHDHPLVARTAGAHPGALPTTGSLAAVEPASVVVTALKPAGNPMARMAGTDMDTEGGVVVRLHEAHGRDVEACLRFATPLLEAARTDLLEQGRTPLDVVDGTLRLALAPYEVATVAVGCEPLTADPVDERGSPRNERAQPVFSDYWLHNRGAAPLGYQPVTVQLPDRAVATDGPFDLSIVVASERTDDAVAGTVEMAVPPGWSAAPGSHPYRLAPGAHARLASAVTPPPDADPGRYFVAARIRDQGGQVHEDVVTVDLEIDDWPGGGSAQPGKPATATAQGAGRALLLERATRKAVVVDRPADPATMTRLGGELRARIAEDPVVVPRGGRGSLTVTLHNLVADEIRGEAQIIAPWGTWEALQPWTQGFAVPAAGMTTVCVDVECPAGLVRTSAWVLLKLMYFGRLLYTPAVPLVLGGAPPPRAAEPTAGPSGSTS